MSKLKINWKDAPTLEYAYYVTRSKPEHTHIHEGFRMLIGENLHGEHWGNCPMDSDSIIVTKRPADYFDHISCFKKRK